MSLPDTKEGMICTNFFFREKKLGLRVAATGATDPEKEVEKNGKNRLKLIQFIETYYM